MRRVDVVTLVGLTVATAVIRIATLRTIDLGGDAAHKWFFVRTWAHANPWIFDHHTARFSINVPIWLVQRLLGSHPRGMFVAPLLAAVVQVPFLYAAGRALGSRATGVLACLLLLVFEPAVDASSQLLPGIFQATYVLAGLHAVLCFAEAPEQRRSALLCAAVWLFLGYLAMVTTVYVLPGVAVAVWLVRRRLADVAWVLGGFGVLLALETLGYALLSEYQFGQFQLILHTHTDVKPTGFWGLFQRYAALPQVWQAVLASWCLCALGALIRGFTAPRSSVAKGAYALWLVPASALAGMTFGVKSLDPIIPATDFSIRYCDVLMPLIALGISTALVWLGGVLLRGRHWPPAATAAAGALALAASSGAALWLFRPSGPSAWAQTDAEWRTINRAMSRNLPIVAVNRTDHLQKKTLICIQLAYLEDRFLLIDGALTLPPLGKTQVGPRTYRYLSREPLSAEAVARAMRKRECALTATRRDSEPKLGLERYAGPSCPAD